MKTSSAYWRQNLPLFVGAIVLAIASLALAK